MPALADRVGETSTATGNGSTFNLAGAKTGYQTFVAGVGAATVTYYAIVHRTSGQWEVGIGTVASGTPDVLTRTTVLSGSSGAGTRVNFSAGTSDVFVSIPASKALVADPTTGDVVAVAALGKLRIDGSLTGDTYFVEGAANRLDVVAGGVIVAQFAATSFTLTQDTAIAATKKLWLDGGGNTYIIETSADLVSHFAGGSEIFRITTAGFTLITGDHVIPATKRVYLDGGGDTYVVEVGANDVQWVVGGSQALRLDANNVILGRTLKFDSAAAVAVAVASTHKITVKDSTGTTYYLLATT